MIDQNKSKMQIKQNTRENGGNKKEYKAFFHYNTYMQRNVTLHNPQEQRMIILLTTIPFEVEMLNDIILNQLLSYYHLQILTQRHIGHVLIVMRCNVELGDGLDIMRIINILAEWNDINICRDVKSIIIKPRVFFKFIFFHIFQLIDGKFHIGDDVATSNNNANSTLAPQMEIHKHLRGFKKKKRSQEQKKEVGTDIIRENKMANSGGDIRSAARLKRGGGGNDYLNHWTLGPFSPPLTQMFQLRACAHYATIFNFLGQELLLDNSDHINRSL
ncbi:hypothetical protein RFI_32007 [Reticulomyxa filosa]|uniref:Uncharacterized protein n=1 Tax=Reticulomyxa filosa TaxID=46433 RepID=X6LUX1_RETFI|nr:hypothetical protein RFI_32007 [Reticulomyxa filosa]|eukprot:ETO05389.1 hypothetical protein RFI_32007 [Reticulomyxa filosa]